MYLELGQKERTAEHVTRIISAGWLIIIQEVVNSFHPQFKEDVIEGQVQQLKDFWIFVNRSEEYTILTIVRKVAIKGAN